VFRAAIAVFILGSVLCGFSTSLTDFVIYRFIQGIGGQRALGVPFRRPAQGRRRRADRQQGQALRSAHRAQSHLKGTDPASSSIR
jgi:MFS family permease